MDANDDEINFVNTSQNAEESVYYDSTLRASAEDVTISSKIDSPPRETAFRVSWVIILFLSIIVVVQTILYLDIKQKNIQIDWQRTQISTRLNQTFIKLSLFEAQNRKMKQEIAKNKEKQTEIPSKIQDTNQGYKTGALGRISEKRKQSSGMVLTPKGTVSQLKQLIKRDGKSIEEVLYKTDKIRNQRIKFNRARIELLERYQNSESLGLSKFTMKIDRSLQEQQQAEQTLQYTRIQKQHSLSAFPSQLPMCIVVPTFNNNAKFRIQYNLNSIFLQNYSNYFAVILNDVSTDGTDEVIRNYLHFYNISTSKYAYVDNTERKTALENIYNAVWDYCSEDAIVVNLDGDDELIGKNVLKIFNANYQKYRMGMIYSNYHRLYEDERIVGGWNGQYTTQVKEQLLFRTSPQLFSHLKTHRAQLFRRIPLKELQDEQGHFYKITYDMAIYYPVMQLSCGRVLKISGYHYLYNFNTGLNDFTLNHEEQLEVERRVREGEKMQCAGDLLKQWDEE